MLFDDTETDTDGSGPLPVAALGNGMTKTDLFCENFFAKKFSEKHQKFQLVLTSKHSKRAGKVQNNIDQSKVYKIFSEKRYKSNCYVFFIWGIGLPPPTNLAFYTRLVPPYRPVPV